nr:glucokinase [uncultured Roseovarius sp.]
MTETWLLADVGASNTRFGLARGGHLRAQTTRSYRNADASGFVELAKRFLTEHEAGPITSLCAGVAGPVRDGAAQLTNLDWHLDSRDLARRLGVGRAHLLNDLQAQGHALDDLNAEDTRCLIAGRAAPAQATRLVLGLGTGCNIAVVHQRESALFVPASETGHTRLPMLPALPDPVIRALGWHGDHLPIEAALCGRGLLQIAAACGSSAATVEEVVKRADSGPEQKALHHYLHILGTVAGDIALAHLPLGGLYLIGGLARAIAPFVPTATFSDAFTNKGPYRDILEGIPIHVVLSDSAALLGCARVLRGD